MSDEAQAENLSAKKKARVESRTAQNYQNRETAAQAPGSSLELPRMSRCAPGNLRV